ncbi:protein SOB FIVE-LIKE 5-like [Cornus florida]|uniref:protein SOB FIVE-LIKE 5-like n=1 Tax=Cornus florida TaxID=4283 RepID=UPI0028992970|nr:protein SOB FIVE-LIKE 5-like [Cornus florida]
MDDHKLVVDGLKLAVILSLISGTALVPSPQTLNVYNQPQVHGRSEERSGCESGWTMYLDQSSNSEDHQFHKSRDHRRCKAEEEEDNEDDKDEDLSMVSDASSGPPHFHEVDQDCYASEKANKRDKKKKSKEVHKGHQHHSYLDDTASSPVLMTYSKKNLGVSSNESSMEHVLGFSQGFSTTHLKSLQGKSTFRKHFGSFKSSVAGKPDSGAAGGV